MSTTSLKLALELAAKVTGRDELTALAGEVAQLGRVSEETAADTERLAQTLDQLTKQQDLIRQFEQSGQALGQLETATAQSRERLAELRREQQQTGAGARQLTDAERLLAAEVKQLEPQLVAQSASHTRLQAGLSQSGINSQRLAQEQARLQRELRQSAQDTEALGRSLLRGGQQSAGFQGAIGSLTGRLVALAGTWFGIQTLTTQLVAMFKSGDQAERLAIQMQAVMGSIEAGKAATGWIEQFAKTTPLQLDQVTQVFVRLKAFGLDPMDGTLQGIVDQAYKLGGSFEEVQGISLALGQAWAKQKLQGEEILQLIERGVPVWELLEKVTGKNTAELQKLSEQGQLGRDTIKALMSEIAAQSSGAAAANMGTLSGLISNAQDNLEKFYRMVANSGAMDWLKGQLAALNNQFDQMANDGRLQQLAQQISDAIVAFGQALKGFAQTVAEWRNELLLLAKAWAGLKVGGWIADLAALYGRFIALPAASAAAAGGMTTAGTAAAGAAIGVRALGGAMKALLALLVVESIIQITQFASALRQLVQAELALRDSQALRAETQAQLNGQFAALSIELGVAITSMADLDRLVAEGKVHYDDATGSWQKGATAVKALGDEAKSTRDYLAEINAVAAQTAAEGPVKLAEAFKQLGLDFEQANGRIGEGFANTVSALDVLVTHTGASSEAIEAALAKAFSQAKNLAEVEAVGEKLEQLAEQGKLTGDSLTRSLGAMAGALEQVKGPSDQTKGAVEAIGTSFERSAERAKGATDAMAAGLRQVQQQADKAGQSVAGVGGGTAPAPAPAATAAPTTRTVGAGSFYYKTVDINQLRGNADALENTLAGVEEEVARYRQKFMDMSALPTSDWARAQTEIFLKEMQATEAKLRSELTKAQAKEQAKEQATAQPQQPTTRPTTAGGGSPDRYIVIELRSGSQRAQVQADEANANALIKLLEQQGLRQ